MSIEYNFGKKEYEDWIISETVFDNKVIGKCESIMSLGNGYMGLRSASEEKYIREQRNLFVAGTFDNFCDNEVTELPNAADITELVITINGEIFSLNNGEVIEYLKELNLKDAELTRSILWKSPKNEKFQLTFRRFISLHNAHLIGMKLEIIPVDGNAKISILSGINGQVTNSGSQHFKEGEKRFHNKKFIEFTQTTIESDIDFVFACHNKMQTENQTSAVTSKMEIDRRKIHQELQTEVNKHETLTFEKTILVYTSRDKEYTSQDKNYSGKYSSNELRINILSQIRAEALDNIKELELKSYRDLIGESISEWQQKWLDLDIHIDSKNSFDQLAVRFALYHMIIMTPSHDNRYGIGAKGFTGEGYKGHSFWDTEVFILPVFMYADPKTARSLLEYRYNTLRGAREKAKVNGYKGAMYPWESAWKDDGEVTPVWGGVDIITGKATKILSGFIEQHITADIAFAAWQYYMITNDHDFMDRYGYEIIFDTATFWTSRFEWDKSKKLYVIKGVMGPDEYKENVDNNAFTNYMAFWNIEKAILYYSFLHNERPDIIEQLDSKIDLKENYTGWNEVIDKIYLPQARAQDSVIPQDEFYLDQKMIDLYNYKNQQHVGSIFQDYSLEQINHIQVSKQADIMILFYLLEDKFSKEVKKANWDYYEPKTLHDSSLSLAIHSVLAADIGDMKLAYSMFERASRIDLGSNMKSSDMGIHSASMGGIWQDVICGFGGVRMLGGKLRIDPKLPEKWRHLKFTIHWRGDILEVACSKKMLVVTKKTQLNDSIDFTVYGKKYSVKDRVKISLK